jgi:hypothetical protein
MLEDITNGRPAHKIKYITRALPRGVADADAIEDALADINTALTVSGINIITINSYTNASAESALCDHLASLEEYTELNVRTLVTTAPSHRIKIFKRAHNTNPMYVVITNLYTETVVFKVAAAISLDVNYIPELNPALQEGLLEGSAEKVYAAINTYYADYEAQRAQRLMDQAMQNLETHLLDAGLAQFGRIIENINEELDQMSMRYQAKLVDLKNAQAQYLLSKLQGNEEIVKPVIQFFNACKKNITYLNVENDTITVVYTTPLSFWETKYYDAYVKSTRPNVINAMMPVHQALFKEIFKDKTIQLLIESGIKINLHTSGIQYADAGSYRNVNTTMLKGIPNPHHYYFNCWGDNKPVIMRALKNNDYVQAFTQAFAAIGGINLTDSAVMGRLCSNALDAYAQTPCLKYKATGEIITIKEYERRFANVSNQND